MNFTEITNRTEARESLIEWAENLLSDAVYDASCPQYKSGDVEKLIANTLELCTSTEEDAKVIQLLKEAAATPILRKKLNASILLAIESPELFR